MKTEEQIRNMLGAYKTDERLYLPNVKVEDDKFLALIQMGMQASINELERILELPLSKFPLKR